MAYTLHALAINLSRKNLVWNSVSKGMQLSLRFPNHVLVHVFIVSMSGAWILFSTIVIVSGQSEIIYLSVGKYLMSLMEYSLSNHINI